jgi:transketolase
VNKSELEALARRVRLRVLEMVHRAGSGHIGSNFSIAELLAVLYGEVLKIDPARPGWEERDRFLLSKGHAAAALYAVLADRGFFPIEWLESFCANGSRLPGHVTASVPGVELSTGSLGHGLGVATGMALAGKRGGESYRVFALLSDGECDEGSNWEAALFAPHHRLDNLTVIIDYNKIQSLGAVKEVIDLEPLAAKWRAFGWAVRAIDGHDLAEVRLALRSLPLQQNKPSCIVAHTVKGKGVSFMENQLLWHYRTPRGAEYDAARAELEPST